MCPVLQVKVEGNEVPPRRAGTKGTIGVTAALCRQGHGSVRSTPGKSRGVQVWIFFPTDLRSDGDGRVRRTTYRMSTLPRRVVAAALFHSGSATNMFAARQNATKHFTRA